MSDSVSNGSLRAADRIALVDHAHPCWYMQIYVRFVIRNGSTLEIAVDSSDHAAITRWKDRIQALNLAD
jgi:hypothetical protein